MKILVVNWQDRLNPQAGGAEHHLHEVFGRLQRRGHPVEMLVSGWAGAAPEAEVDGMRVRRVGGRHTFGAAAPLAYRRELRKQGYDVVVEALNKVPTFSPLWAGAPVVLLVHHLFGATAFREASPPVAALTWALERPLPWVYRGRPAQTISESTADDLVRRGLRRRDLTVIRPGIDVERFTPGPDDGRFPEPTFLYLGRLKRYKGVDLTLRALRRVRDQGIDARLVVAGSGDALAGLRTLASTLQLSDAVDFRGFVSEADKVDLFRRCWANLFVSPKEGWGITNVEAAACGTPAIASDSPGLRESVVNGTTGVLVPHGDVARLAAAMAEFATSPALVEQLGQAARAFAASLTWDRTADETERHLQGVLDRPAVESPRTAS